MKKKRFDKFIFFGQVILYLFILIWPYIQFSWMVLLGDGEVTIGEITKFVSATLLMGGVIFFYLKVHKRKTRILLIQLIFLITSVAIVEFFWLGSIADIFRNERQENLITIRNLGTIMNTVTLCYISYMIHNWVLVRKKSKTKFGI